MSKKIVVLDAIETAIAVSEKKLKSGFLEIKTKTEGVVPDLTKETGRIDFASVCHSVSLQKTDQLQPITELVKGLKKSIKPLSDLKINYTKKYDNYRKELRKPLTEWEIEDKKNKEKEKKRIFQIEEQIIEIEELAPSNPALLTTQKLEDRIKHLKSNFITSKTFQEFQPQAEEARGKSLRVLETYFVLAKDKEKIDLKKIELERQEKAIRLIQTQAEERAIQIEQEAISNRKRIEKIEESRLKAIEDGKRQATEELEKEKKIAKEKTANLEHRRTVNRNVIQLFTNKGYTEKKAIDILRVIINGKSPFITINY